MNITIRSFADSDTAEVQSLLDTLWGADNIMSAIYSIHKNWSGLLRRTIVATPVDAPDTILGVGTIFESTLHPGMLMVAIHVHPAHQRKNIGSRIFNSLQELSDGRSWLVKLIHSDRAGTLFFEKHGFHIAVRTLSGEIDTEDKNIHAWLGSLPVLPPRYKITALSESGTSLESFALMQAAIYRQFHRWNPPIVEDTQQAIEHYCHPNKTITSSNFCVFRDDELVGVTNLIGNPFSEDDTAYLVNMGVLDGVDDADKIPLTAQLIRRIVDFAHAKGKKIVFEVDSTYIPNYNLLEQFPAQNKDDDFIIMTNRR